MTHFSEDGRSRRINDRTHKCNTASHFECIVYTMNIMSQYSFVFLENDSDNRLTKTKLQEIARIVHSNFFIFLFQVHLDKKRLNFSMSFPHLSGKRPKRTKRYDQPIRTARLHYENKTSVTDTARFVVNSARDAWYERHNPSVAPTLSILAFAIPMCLGIKYFYGHSFCGKQSKPSPTPTPPPPPPPEPECIEQICVLTRLSNTMTFIHDASVSESMATLSEGTAVELPPTSNNPKDLTFHGTTLLTIEAQGTKNPQIWSVLKSNGALVTNTVIQTTPDFEFGVQNASLAYDMDQGTLYILGQTRAMGQAEVGLFAVSPSTGIPTLIGLVGIPLQSGGGLGFSEDGRLFLGGSVNPSSLPAIYELDLSPSSSSEFIQTQIPITLDPNGPQFEFSDEQSQINGLAWSTCLGAMVALLKNGRAEQAQSFIGIVNVDTGVFRILAEITPNRPEGIAIRRRVEGL